MSRLGPPPPARIGVRSLPVVSYCPSARAGVDGAVVFGIVGEGKGGRLGYLSDLAPASEEVMSLAGEADAAEVFRVAAPCAEGGCQHHDAGRCRLAARVSRKLPKVVDALPACRLRPTCLWWRQEGRDACLRCPQIVSSPREPTELLVQVADPSRPEPG